MKTVHAVPGTERPKHHVCMECGSRFSTNSTLRKHIRTHTGKIHFLLLTNNGFCILFVCQMWKICYFITCFQVTVPMFAIFVGKGSFKRFIWEIMNWNTQVSAPICVLNVEDRFWPPRISKSMQSCIIHRHHPYPLQQHPTLHLQRFLIVVKWWKAVMQNTWIWLISKFMSECTPVCYVYRKYRYKVIHQ